jgi:serine/threonine-protein kinase
MASVHLGRMLGPKGFGKTVALKRMNEKYAKDPDFVKMFHDEARVTSGLTHANIVMTLDVLEEPDSLYLVMEYVNGVSLSQIRKELGDQPLPVPIITGILVGVLDGLHAAHEARDERGGPLGVIHRDVSPQNVLVTFQGVPKIADFGIAHAAGRLFATADGTPRGKVIYMAPEQFTPVPLDTKVDIYATGVVLWECLTGQKLISGKSPVDKIRDILTKEIAPPSSLVPGLPPELDEIVLRALARDPGDRFASAKEMGTAIRRATEVAQADAISDWVRATCVGLIEQHELHLANLQAAISEMSQTSAEEAPPSTGADPPAMAIQDHAPERKRPRWFVPALAACVLAGIAGAALIAVAAKPARHESSVAIIHAASGSGTPLSTPAPPSSVVEIAAPSPVESGTPEKPLAPSVAASTRPRASAAKRTCKVVAAPDANGHVKFTEVCH